MKFICHVTSRNRMVRHFPKIHRSVLRKITIDLLYLETFMASIYEKKISAEVRLFHAEQMYLYNFIILRKKQWTQMKTKQLKQDILNQ